jgi:hypothetical protein
MASEFSSLFSQIPRLAGVHPTAGYRRLDFMMLDADVVALSPSSTYRVLRDARLRTPKAVDRMQFLESLDDDLVQDTTVPGARCHENFSPL